MEPNGRLAEQYDRALRCLERRLEASDLPRSQGMRRRIREALEQELTPNGTLELANHFSLLELSRDEEGTTRLLTTNFDTLFERAWRRAMLTATPSHAGPAMPHPGTGAFEGVLHLHGRIKDAELGLPGTDLILTSAEFGEAYFALVGRPAISTIWHAPAR